ncbi:hypothetical protein LL037_21180 [Clostridium estertheticum]|uniref:hypothetical protein n=1 Tax=Clostridium estertheticum TaxID=238834 RepID=UPI001C0DA133|nr:hypothetical protein [Clostridium estertheticum]MBU3198258.1 hypothetical protein [Clostridium estertheticum]MCB2354395.1 hypothetical protein [Clostridium estertheticum]WAG42488.1 hypothetical protein LL065_07380 [Clostridium estertheticum]WAG64949.1 hypothetical protein LL037_21180 [Clostridium estertheticum]
MKKIAFVDMWQRIITNEGNTFKTKTEIEFTYKILGNGLITTRTEYKLSKGDFEKAYSMMPIDGPGVISNLVRGSAYIWSILNDNRIY